MDHLVKTRAMATNKIKSQISRRMIQWTTKDMAVDHLVKRAQCHGVKVQPLTREYTPTDV
jgi:hypothetical protein